VGDIIEQRVLPLLDDVRTTLAKHMAPAPDDLLEGIPLTTQLFYVQQIVMELVATFTAELMGSQELAEEVPDNVQKAHVAVLEAAGLLTGALIAFGVLPDEAGA
jgi:hypothetical protein